MSLLLCGRWAVVGFLTEGKRMGAAPGTAPLSGGLSSLMPDSSGELLMHRESGAVWLRNSGFCFWMSGLEPHSVHLQSLSSDHQLKMVLEKT